MLNLFGLAATEDLRFKVKLPSFKANKVYAVGMGAFLKARDLHENVISFAGKNRYETARQVLNYKV